MNRRSYLETAALTGIGVLAGLAGCLGSGSRNATFEGTDPAPETVSGNPERAASLREPDLPVPKSALERGARKDAIPAITKPEFAADWSDVSATLRDDEDVIGVAAGGHARAYPLAILNWHEVVNDKLGGPLLVTYCPLCGSGVVAERTVDAEASVFGVSGFLWRNDLVMYDTGTNSKWSQLLATAIRGEATGTTLSLRPSTLATWGDWRAAHPETEVLLPPPTSGTITGDGSRNYEAHPYAGYDRNAQIGVGGTGSPGRLHPKVEVLGIATDDTATAYPLEAVRDAGGVVNDTVGDRPVVVATTAAGAIVGYDRRVDGTVLTFERTDDGQLRAGGSTWEPVSGRALDGPHEGTSLVPATDRSPLFWFAWTDFFPQTDVYEPNK